MNNLNKVLYIFIKIQMINLMIFKQILCKMI